MAETPYLKLPLTSDLDSQKTFLDWRRQIDGDVDSDMLKIDKAIQDHNNSPVATEIGVHGIRNYNGVLQFQNSDGEWVNVMSQSAMGVYWGSFDDLIANSEENGGVT